jgi:transposase
LSGRDDAAGIGVGQHDYEAWADDQYKMSPPQTEMREATGLKRTHRIDGDRNESYCYFNTNENHSINTLNGQRGRFVVEVIDGLDLSELVKAYRGSGSASYHPAMLLVYGYATKVFSSRAIERATHDSVAFRYIADNEHPDHDTIEAFRKRFLPQLRPLFIEVLKLARTMGMLKLGTVALDGTKVHANASRHSALSYGHAKKIEKQLKRGLSNCCGSRSARMLRISLTGCRSLKSWKGGSCVWRRSPKRRQRLRGVPRSAWSASKPSIKADSPPALSRRSRRAKSHGAARPSRPPAACRTRSRLI